MLVTISLLACVLVRSAEALTQAEINQFTNNGCAGGKVSVQISGNEIIVTTNDRPDHMWQLVQSIQIHIVL